MKFANITDKLNYNIVNLVKDNEFKLGALIKDINAKNPLVILEKGYAKLEKENHSITTIKQLSVNDKIIGNLKDGNFIAEIKEINNGF